MAWARLVMAERFSQFSGLVDNCEFRRGEKETTVEDLQGFWEMIFLQVEDVDRRFDSLKEIEENNWQRPQPKDLCKVSKPRTKKATAVSETKPAKQATSGLKALIAARRRAAKSCSEVRQVNIEQEQSKEEGRRVEEKPEVETEGGASSQITFDGGFFMVKSPCVRKSPRMKSSTLTARQTPVDTTGSSSKLNSLLLSPFISAVAKMSLSLSGKS